MRTRRMERLWDRMQALYGSRWLLEYGQVTANGRLATIAEIWATALDGASNAQIATALRKCLERDKESPPTLPEFLRLCGARFNRAEPHEVSQIAGREIYAESLANKCARLAEEAAERAKDDLAVRLESALPDQRPDIIRTYWMAKIGQSIVGQQLTKAWSSR